MNKNSKYSFEEKSGASASEMEEISKRSITKSLDHLAGMCRDEEYKRVQKYMDGENYEVLLYLTSDMLQFGEENGTSKFVF